MTGAVPRDSPRSRIIPGLLVAGLALAIAVSLSLVSLPGSSGSEPAATWLAASPEWNNGVVLCVFNSTSPSVAVSAFGLNDSGLSSSLSQVAEVNPEGATVAVASVAQASWNAWNASVDDTFDQAYQAHVALLPASGSAPPLGAADLRVDYTLPAYAGSGSGSLSSVTAVFQVSNWSWQNPADRLVLTLPLWPTFAQAEHLGGQGSNGAEVTSWSTATGDAREYVQLSDRANATPVGGATASVGVSPVVSLSPSFASVNVTVGSSAGDFVSMSYVATVSIAVPAHLAGLPLYDYALVAGAAAALSILVAAGTLRVRRRPSDLQYVEEEP
jgi:hypothetical protein